MSVQAQATRYSERSLSADMRVLEIGDTCATAAVAHYLWLLGADVEKLALNETGETDGPAGRSLERELAALLDRGKTVRWLGSAAEITRRLRHPRADVIVTGMTPATLARLGWLAPLRAAGERHIWLSITPYGLTGPWRDLPASDLALCAESGIMATVGDPEREPLRLPGSLPSLIGAQAAFAALTSALYERQVSGQGQIVDVSLLEVMTSSQQMATVLFAHTGRQQQRNRGRLASGAPWTLLPCKDGHAGIIVPEAKWSTFVDLAQMPELAAERFATRDERIRHVDDLEAVLRTWLQDKAAEDVYEWGQTLQLPWAAVRDIKASTEEPHLWERGFLTRDEGGTIVTGLPARVRFADSFTAHPGSPAAGAVPPRPGAAACPLLADESDPRARSLSGGKAEGPLAGVRVIDFGIAWAGALAGRLLADFGAEVIKIDTRRRLDTRGALQASSAGVYLCNDPGGEPWNRAASFVDRHRNKYSLALELDSEAGRGLFLRLVEQADAVMENFSPRVMANFGLSYDVLAAINPRLVALSMSGFGHTGPKRAEVAFGDTIEQLSGATHATGYAGDEPLNSGTLWPDCASGYFGAALVAAGVRHARRTGVGMHLDVSELEVALKCLPDVLAFLRKRGQAPPRLGNGHWSGFEACCVTAGGEYIVVSARGRHNRRRLAALVDAGEAANDAELDAALRLWCTARTSGETLAVLRELHVPCGRVRLMRDVFEHEQLRARGFFERVVTAMDSYETIGMIARLSRTPGSIRKTAPKFGEDNALILSRLLNLDEEAVARMVAAGAVSSRPG